MQIIHAPQHSRNVNACQAGIANSAIARFGVRRSAVNLAQRLSAMIEGSGLSQAEVARRAGISASRLANYLSGHRTPDPQLLDRIAAVLGTDVDQLNGATESLSQNLASILATLFRLNGLPPERGALMAEVAVEALRALRSLPPEGDAALRSRLAAQIAWQQHSAPKQER